MFSEQGGETPTAPDEDGQETEVQPGSPDEDAGPAVEPVEGDQGEQVATPSEPGFNPDAPRATSAPPPEAQSGVPDLPGGDNADVEPPSDDEPQVGASEESGQTEGAEKGLEGNA
jgi:hypothetical protein